MALHHPLDTAAPLAVRPDADLRTLGALELGRKPFPGVAVGVDQDAGGGFPADGGDDLVQPGVVGIVPGPEEPLPLPGVEVGPEGDVADAAGVDGAHAERGGRLDGVVAVALDVGHQPGDGGGDGGHAEGLDGGEELVGAVVDEGDVLPLQLGVVDGETGALGERDVAGGVGEVEEDVGHAVRMAAPGRAVQPVSRHRKAKGPARAGPSGLIRGVLRRPCRRRGCASRRSCGTRRRGRRRRWPTRWPWPCPRAGSRRSPRRAGRRGW